MNVSFAMFNMPELLALLVLGVLLFGAKKLPELARGLGQGIKEFKKATREDEIETAVSIPPATDKASLPNGSAAAGNAAPVAPAQSQPKS